MCYNSSICLNCTKFASGALSLVSLVLALFPCFLAQAVPRLLCTSLLLNLEPLAPPQGPGSLYMGIIFWNQDLSARYAHCYSSITVSRPRIQHSAYGLLLYSLWAKNYSNIFKQLQKPSKTKQKQANIQTNIFFKKRRVWNRDHILSLKPKEFIMCPFTEKKCFPITLLGFFSI